jgi:hypothetical protein
MLFEQYQTQDLLTPSINDGGVSKLNSSLTSLDFYLLDDIDAYLSPIQSKSSKNDLINDNINNNSQHQDEYFFDFDFNDLPNFDENSSFLDEPISIDELEIEKWISQSSFPSPPMEANDSPLSSIEETLSNLSSIGDEYTKNIDMIVPPSPPLSSIGSSPAPVLTKKQKLSPVERKLRKKDQNKTAAEKYRIKKKSERHQLLDRHLKLKNINKELKLELENLTYQVQQFKQLFTNFI